MGIKLTETVITEADKQRVMSALESGWINTTGKYINLFENKLAQITNTKYAVTLANGTSALFMALKALGIGPGHKVGVPTITYIATVNAIVHTGAEPVFFDCHPDTLNINIFDLTVYLKNNKLDCLVPVHIFGNPCNMGLINDLAKYYNFKVVEDACEALGSTYKDEKCGSLSDTGCLSFSFNKMITSGSGGAIITNNKEAADKIKYWIRQSKDDETNYIHNEVGYNLGLTNIQAALGYSQICRLEQILKDKKRVLQQYQKNLGDKIIYQDGGNCWFVGYKTSKRKEITKALSDNNIETRRLWRPNHLQKPFRIYNRVGNMHNSTKAYDTIINLPCGVNLSSNQIDHICAIILYMEKITCH